MGRGPDIATGLVPYFHVRYRAPCNLRCFYCYERPHPARMPDDVPAEIEDGLRTARAAGYRAVVFGAAELLLLPFREEAVRLAKRLGFERVGMLSNLVALDERKLEGLARAGLDEITGTVFALDDAGAQAVSGGRNVFSRQVRAATRVAARGGPSISVHAILTRPLAVDLASSVLRLRDLFAPDGGRMIVSAIEPISDEVLGHPDYVHGLDLDWARIMVRTDREGLRLVVQNIPACLLGRYAHRSLFLRMRVARALAGLPRYGELARFVERTEGLSRRIPPVGDCVGCRWLAVCHRYYGYPVKRRVTRIDERAVVRRLLAEEGVRRDADRIVSVLRSIDARPGPARGR
jgi:hypothetical protein